MRDTIDMAREAGIKHDIDGVWCEVFELKAFEALVRADEDFYLPVQDSTCNETLRAQGKAYPRTCKKCGKGPCIGAPKQPPAQPAVPDAITDNIESPEYRTGWNDCRAEMLRMRKP